MSPVALTSTAPIACKKQTARLTDSALWFAGHSGVPNFGDKLTISRSNGSGDCRLAKTSAAKPRIDSATRMCLSGRSIRRLLRYEWVEHVTRLKEVSDQSVNHVEFGKRRIPRRQALPKLDKYRVTELRRETWQMSSP